MQYERLFFFLPCLLLLSCNQQTPQQSLPQLVVDAVSVQNSSAVSTMTVTGSVVYGSGILLTFNVPGKLETGSAPLKVGDRFTKGQLLFQVNNREAYRNYSSRKKQLAAAISVLTTELETSQQSKWNVFAAELELPNLLPDFPSYNSAQEREQLQTAGIERDYRALVKQEKAMKDYFFVAPFDGIVLEIAVQPGSTIRRGQQVALIGRNRELIITTTVPEDCSPDSTAQLVDPHGRIVGTAIVSATRSSKNGMLELRYKPVNGNRLKNGNTVTLALHLTLQPSHVVLPATAVQHGSVWTIHNGKLQKRTVRVLSSTGDSLHVNGLADGSVVAVMYPKNVSAKQHVRADIR